MKYRTIQEKACGAARCRLPGKRAGRLLCGCFFCFLLAVLFLAYHAEAGDGRRVYYAAALLIALAAAFGPSWRWAGLLRALCAMVSGFTLFFALLFACALTAARSESEAPGVTRAQVFAGKSVLVVVPHEDDDVNLMAGLLEQFGAASTLRVLFVTNGDYGGDAETRIGEAIASLALSGVPEENVLFLGYGDQWDDTYGHIFMAPADEVLTSMAGKNRTYGTSAHPPYRDSLYTRENLISDLAAVLTAYRPDTLFCVDGDPHADHYAVSLFFENALGRVLAENPGYAPEVYKGFAYATAWMAVDDFYAPNPLSTGMPVGSTSMQFIDAYGWENRVRFPISAQAAGSFLLSNPVFAQLTAYASQTETPTVAARVINGDRVFFYRPTGSLLYGAELTGSSGKTARLTDFMLFDTADLFSSRPIESTKCWMPEAGDEERRINVTLAAPSALSSLTLYDNPSEADNILNAEVLFSDGSSIQTGPLQRNGGASVVEFPEKTGITGFTLRLTETEGAYPGLAELEAYGERSLPAGWIKLTDAAGDFAYDYRTDATGEAAFSLYEAFSGADAAVSLPERFVLSLEGEGCAAAFDEEAGCVRVSCPRGKSCLVRVSSKADPSVYDAVRVSNPGPLARFATRLVMRGEQLYIRIYSEYGFAGQRRYIGDVRSRGLRY